MKISHEPELITPQQAEKWLKTNEGNRKLSPSHVRFLTEQILSGQWKLTPDTIKLSRSGRLLDGQHRLTAIVESGKAQQMYIARDCEEDIFSVLDTGKNRTAADVVGIAGFKNASHVASTARLIFTYRTSAFSGLKSKKRFATNGDVLALLGEIDLVPVVQQGFSYYTKSRLLSVPEYSFLRWLLGARHAEEAEGFLYALSSGVGLLEGSPVLLLRRKLESARSGERFTFTPVERLALSVKAWNLKRLGKSSTMLTFNPERESFPEAV